MKIIMCPPLIDYPEPPKDQSHCELFDCPMCKEKMWLSEKKKGVLMFSSCIGNDILLGCYRCIRKVVAENPTFFTKSKKVNL